jgi:hypothetical protein
MRIMAAEKGVTLVTHVLIGQPVRSIIDLRVNSAPIY